MILLITLLVLSASIIPLTLRLIAQLLKKRYSLTQGEGRLAYRPQRALLVPLSLFLACVSFLGLWQLTPLSEVWAQGTDLQVTKQLADPAKTTYLSGEEIVFNIAYRCAKVVGNCTNVTVTDNFVPALQFLSAGQLPPGATYTQSGQQITVNLGDLAAGDNGIFKISARFPIGTPPGTVATNTVTIAATGSTPVTSAPPVTVNSDGSFQMTVNKGVIANNQTGVIGTQFQTTYQLNVCNPNSGIGGVGLQNATITDTLPAEATPITPIPLGGTYISATRQIVWTGINVPVTSGCYTLNVPVTFDPATPGVISGTVVNNQFQVRGNRADTNAPVNLGPVGVNVTLRDPYYDASAGKLAGTASDHPDDPGVEELAGGSVNYTLIYTNEGTLPITNLVITDSLPAEIAQVTLVQVSPLTPTQPVTFSYELNNSGLWIVEGQYVTTTLVDLSSQSKVTGLRWELGQMTLNIPRWYASYGGVLSSTLSPGQSALNCFTASGVSGGSNRLEGSCMQVDVIAPRAIPRIEKSLSAAGPFLPEEIVTYTLRVRNDDVAHNVVTTPIVLADVVTDNLDVVVFSGGSWRPATPADAWFSYNGPLPAPTETLAPSGTATLVRWAWNSGTLAPGEAITVTFAVQVKKGTPPGPVNNVATTLWDGGTNNPLPCVGGQVYTDTQDIDQDGNTLETGCQSNNIPVNVRVFLAMKSEKFVLGQLDGGIWNKDGLTVPGGQVDYRMVITNISNVTTTDIVAYDIFPFVGDTGVVDVNNSRDSDWRPNLQAPITVPVGMPLTLQYSRSQNPCRPELIPGGPAGCTNDWSTTPPADITSVQAVRFEFCKTGTCLELAPDPGDGTGGRIEFTWHMQAPNDAPPDPSRAWNSFGFTAEGQGLQLLPAEPNKVGIRVQYPLSNTVNLGNYVWLDVFGLQKDGVQQPQEPGINGVRVELLDEFGNPADVDGNGQPDYRITGPDANGNAGYYLFISLSPNMTYTVRFYPPVTYTLGGPELPVIYTTSPAIQGGNDALDSNGILTGTNPTGDYIQTGLITTTLALTTDLRWDQGLWLPTDYGDAPNSYNTQASTLVTPADAARHVILPGIHMGADVDAELDGDATTTSFGDDVNDGNDDENGVTFDYFLGTPAQPTPVMIIGATSRMTVSTTIPASFTGYLNAWIDFNRDGDFDDAGEQIATDQAAPNGGGNISLSVLVPTTAISGSSYSRFRFSTEQGLGPSGSALNGEVEDYPVLLRPGDLGDLPNTYRTLVANNGARHVITETNNPTLGSIVDDEFNGQPNATATGDDTNKSDDEDGVVFSEIIPGEVMTVTVTASPAANGVLNAWIDFNNDGDFNDFNERLATDQAISAGSSVVLTTTVPITAAQNSQAYSRFRFSSQSGLQPTGLAFDGEVEDYAQPILPLDYGDLPDTAGHPTVYASDGARHIIRTSGGNPTLGSRVDAESNGQPTTAANGDDNNNSVVLTYGAVPGDDENGVNFNNILWVPGKVATITVSALAAASGGANGLLNAWIDFNNDGDFNDLNEQIATNLNLTAGGSQSLSFSIPATTIVGNVYSRFRFSSQSDLTPSDLALNGEVEDYRYPIVQLDYGDAPDSFGTTDSATGAFHVITPSLRLGTIVDAETNGQPSINADGDDTTTGSTIGGAPGDDEDGIFFNTPIAPGAPATITVVAVGAGVLNGWIDFNGNGIFDAGERIFNNTPVAGTGSYSLSFTVPATATLGPEYARFRYSSATLTGPTGPANDGEVEDYRVEIVQLDYGDLPNAGIAAPPDYLTTLAENGPRHIILPANNPTLGSTVDSEPTGQPSTNADGDGADEDGVTFLSGITPGEVMTLTVTAAPTAGGILNAWIDFNGDGDFNDLNEQLAADQTILTGQTITLNANVPLTATQGITTYSRFRFSSQAGLQPSGLAPDGEVEDYAQPIQRLDYGDLPAGLPGYPTNYAANGARHIILPSANPTLGASVDAETDGNPSADASGDDTNGSDDENGVTFNSLLVPGKVATITVSASGANGYLNGWMDFNNNGQLDAGEQIATDTLISAGTSISLSFNIPLTATLGPINTRFRFSSQTGLTPSGLAPDGEVEDYQVILGELDYGDLPDSYATTDSQNGAYHIISPTLHLGPSIDSETDGQPTPNADGDDITTSDDEDGITFNTPLAPGEVATITVVNTGNGNFSGWVDFNSNGSFDAGERVFTNTLLTAGTHTLTFTVPANAVPSTSIGVRFRYTTDILTSPAGPASNGEVEDYIATIPQVDLGDLPDSSIAGTPAYPTTRADDGARHLITSTVFLGSRVDVDSDGQPSANADGDDTNDTAGTPSSGNDDEDGVRFLTPLMPGQAAQIEVSSTAGVLNAWVDFNGDGDFNDAGEQIFTEQAVSSGTQVLTINVPAAVSDTLYSRFRLTANTGEATTPTGLAPNGEVEDYVLLSLGNQVWFDSNNDGLLNGGETGISGVTVTLVISGTSSPIATTVTDGTGHYLFTGLTPGDYQVIIPAANFGSSGQLFGYTSSSVTDTNADNADDNDDNGLDNPNPAANGIHSSGLTLSPGSEPTGDGNGPNSNLTVDFGFYPGLRLGNRVWFDLDNNGLLDGSESGVPTVTLSLLDGSGNLVNNPFTGQPYTTTTDVDGFYLFTHLLSGTYQVHIDAVNFQSGGSLQGYTSSDVTVTDPNSDIDDDDNGLNNASPALNGIRSGLINLADGGEPSGEADEDDLLPDDNSNLTVDFGFYQLLSLGNLVWYDADNDGQKDSSELGLTNVIVALLDGSGNPVLDGVGNPITTTTNAGGQYLFTGLISGTYQVQIINTNFGPGGPLEDFISSTPTQANADSDTDNDDNGLDNNNPAVNGITSGPVTLTPLNEPNTPVDGDGTNGNQTVDFGFFEPLRLGNRVWIDDNTRNGQIDLGESGVAKVVLNLLDGSGNPVLNTVTGLPITTTTDAGGYYTFTNLISGTYVVEVAAGNFQTGGPLDGYLSTSPTQNNAGSDTDLDDNGLDNNNPAVNGIHSGPVVLTPDNEPAGEVDETGNWPDTNSNLTVDFGFIIPASLGNYVWLDADGDGEQDSSEAGVNGVTVNLWADTDNDGVPDTIVLTTTTTISGTQDGYYVFTDLIPNLAYQVEFRPPTGYDFTTPDQVADTSDSDANPSTGFTPVVILTPGENNDTIDAGIYQPGLELDKSIAIAQVVPHQVVSYTIRITNTGNVTLNPVAVTDTLEAGLTYVPGSANPPEDAINGQQLTWNDVMGGAGLAPGTSTQITLLASVTTIIGTYQNAATAEGVHPTGSITNTDTVSVIVSDPALALDKQVVAPGPVDGIITFTIRITNTGVSILDQVPLFDSFTGPVQYIGGTPQADTVDQVNKQLAWNDLTTFFGDLAPGQSIVVTTVFSLTTTDTDFSMTNAAQVRGANDVLNNNANDAQDAVSLVNVPTAIDLLYFTSQKAGDFVELHWATAVEYDNYGFRLLRSASGNIADAVEIGFVPGQGQGTVSGSTYTFTDSSVTAGQSYTYWLVDVDFNGVETPHAETTAINLNAGGGTSIYLPLISK